MSKKDYFTLTVAAIIFLASAFFIYRMVTPKKAQVVNDSTQSGQEQVLKGSLDSEDQSSLEKIKKLTDYGEAQLDNIGRVNPFGPLN